jgi:hypothetical protein
MGRLFSLNAAKMMLNGLKSALVLVKMAAPVLRERFIALCYDGEKRKG